jgi:hypothetical protein
MYICTYNGVLKQKDDEALLKIQFLKVYANARFILHNRTSLQGLAAHMARGRGTFVQKR